MEVKAKSEHLLTLKGNLMRRESSKNYIAFQNLDNPDRNHMILELRRTSS